MTEMRLTVIGCSAAAERPGGACSSYLVTYGALNILLDCGPGSLSILRYEINPRNLDAIVLSHCHADHTLDLIPLCYFLKYGPRDGTERAADSPKLALFVPPGGKEFLDGLARAVENGPSSEFWSPFDIQEYHPNGTLVFGGDPDEHGDAAYVNIRFTPAKHYIPAWAMKVFLPGDRPHPLLVYGADGVATDHLIEFAHGADLLILESTLDTPEEPPTGHMTPRQAAELARAAGDVKRLLLTHYWGHIPPERMLSEARAVFHGALTVAKERDRYVVGE
jgi:ribonuclease BN (tRNA processing enzyme)